MYPQCRHVRAGGATCNAPSIKGSYWCYFHSRLHQRQTVHHALRLSDGRFAPAETVDYGTYPVRTDGEETHRETAVSAPGLDLPPVEDAASIQLALIDVLQALANNRLDPKRAGLLLYGLQVASVNVKNNLSHGDIRSVTHTEDGTPLAPQEFGFDLEDFAALEDEKLGA